MNEEHSEESSPVLDLIGASHETVEWTETKAKGAVSTGTRHVRENPWVILAVAAVAGGVVFAMVRPRKPSLHAEAVRDWLDEAYAKLPSGKRIQSIAVSSGIPAFVAQVQKQLHLR